jgi:hypothetical protein
VSDTRYSNQKTGEKMLKILTLGAALAVLVASPALAGPCEDNFSQEGVPLMTAISFKTWRNFSSAAPAQVLDRLARAVLAEGFVDMRVNKAYGAITAYQETSGSGREQQLRVVTRKAGNGTRVDLVFSIQQGQLAAEGPVRSALCRMVAAGAG